MYLPAPDESLWIGVLRVVLHLPGSRSLKDRRKVVSGLRDRWSARHRVAVAEVGHRENVQMAVLAAAVVGDEPQAIRARLDILRAEAGGHPEAQLVDHQVDIHPFRGA